MTIDGDKLVAAIRARGVESSDLRYCAHEAHHALVCGVRKPWSVDAIDAAMRRTFKMYTLRFCDEIRARAVEQIICRRAGVDCGSVERWALVTSMECMKIDRVNVGDPAGIAAAVELQIVAPRTIAMADAVIALVNAPTKRRRKPAAEARP